MAVHFHKIQLRVFNTKKHEEFIETRQSQVVLTKNEYQLCIDEANKLFKNEITYFGDKCNDLTPSGLIGIFRISHSIDISNTYAV